MNVRTKRGFTLIELMIVVAIIGILAAIAIPKFSQLITKGNEADTKGNLGAIRSALSIYYGDTEGVYPLDDLVASLTTNNKYMNTIPYAKLPAAGANNQGHGDSNSVHNAAIGITPDDTAGWAYDNTSADPDFGRVLANCTHKDTRATMWTAY